MTEQRGLALEESLQAESQQLLLRVTDEIKPHSSSEGVWAVTLDAGKVRYEDGWHDAKAGVVFWAEPAYNEDGVIEGARAAKQSYVAEVGSMEKA